MGASALFPLYKSSYPVYTNCSVTTDIAIYFSFYIAGCFVRHPCTHFLLGLYRDASIAGGFPDHKRFMWNSNRNP